MPKVLLGHPYEQLRIAWVSSEYWKWWLVDTESLDFVTNGIEVSTIILCLQLQAQRLNPFIFFNLSLRGPIKSERERIERQKYSCHFFM